MAYQKIGFKNGNVLTAEQLIHMEDGIVAAEKKAGTGGTGLPSDVGAYKYMATDGSGEWQAVDRLGYKEAAKTFLDLKDYQLYVGFNDFESGAFDWLEEGKTYNVTIKTPSGETKNFTPTCELNSGGTHLHLSCDYTSDGYLLGIRYVPSSGKSYISDSGDGGVFSVTVTGEAIKRFDGELMPKGYPHITYEYKPLMEYQTATTEKHIYVNAYVANDIANGIPVNIGDAYKVVFNGETYECVAHNDDGSGVDHIGNADIDDAGSITHGSGYPFCFQISAGGDWRLFTDTPGEYTFSVYLKEKVVHSMDAKFLPNPIPAEYLPVGFVPTAVIKSSDYDNALAGVAVARDDAAPYECVNMTFEEAYQLLASGKPLQVVAMVSAGGPVCLNAMVGFMGTSMGVPCLLVTCGMVGVDGNPANLFTAYWTADGISTAAPSA